MAKYYNIFKYLPIENLIEKNQKAYFQSLEASDKSGNSNPYIEYILNIIKLSLDGISKDLISITHTFETRIEKARLHIIKAQFNRKKYMELFRDISTSKTSRDLKMALEQKILKKDGSGNQTNYIFLSHT